MNTYTAIDFETGCLDPTSACAIGMAKIRNSEVVETFYSLIKPPDGIRIWSKFTLIHGITNADVTHARNFLQIWTDIEEFIGSDILIAHNAPFDSGVFNACLHYYQILCNPYQFECTVALSRKKLPKPVVPNHKLNTLCNFFGIKLNHHEALSDAIGCAKIWIALQNQEKLDV